MSVGREGWLDRAAHVRDAESQASWERALVAQAQAGNEDAFETLVRWHQDRAYGVALRMTGHTEDAKDVVQDALVYAWESLPGFRGESRVGTWLLRIVINRCHNLRRAARPTVALPVDDASEVASVPGTDWQVVTKHHYDATVRAIAALPFDQRAVLVLRTFDGCTHAEIGRILGITEGTAKVRLHRARQTLDEQLREWR